MIAIANETERWFILRASALNVHNFAGFRGYLASDAVK